MDTCSHIMTEWFENFICIKILIKFLEETLGFYFLGEFENKYCSLKEKKKSRSFGSLLTVRSLLLLILIYTNM